MISLKVVQEKKKEKKDFPVDYDFLKGCACKNSFECRIYILKKIFVRHYFLVALVKEKQMLSIKWKQQKKTVRVGH